MTRGVETKLRERIPWFEKIVSHEPEGDVEEHPPPNGLPVLPMVQVSPGAPPASNGGELLQIDQIQKLKRPVFVDVGTLAELGPGEMTHADVEGNDILIINLDNEPYAFRNVCPTDGRSTLDGGRLTQGVLVCGWHNCAYDARSGKRVDDEPNAKPLAVVPIAVSDGVLRVAANVA